MFPTPVSIRLICSLIILCLALFSSSSLSLSASSLFIYLSYLCYFYWSIHLSTNVIYFYLSVRLYILLSIYIYLNTYLYICLSICLSIFSSHSAEFLNRCSLSIHPSIFTSSPSVSPSGFVSRISNWYQIIETKLVYSTCASGPALPLGVTREGWAEPGLPPSLPGLLHLSSRHTFKPVSLHVPARNGSRYNCSAVYNSTLTSIQHFQNIHLNMKHDAQHLSIFT